MYVCVYACVYVCMHACMYVCMHVANTSKRALVRPRLGEQAVAGDSERESNDDVEAAYLRRVLIGDRTFSRGFFFGKHSKPYLYMCRYRCTYIHTSFMHT